MNFFTACPCCSNSMVRQISNHKTYWFCRHCWQEMPDLDAIVKDNCTQKYKTTNSLVYL